jgi:hypothetical protein
MSFGLRRRNAFGKNLMENERNLKDIWGCDTPFFAYSSASPIAKMKMSASHDTTYKECEFIESVPIPSHSIEG